MNRKKTELPRNPFFARFLEPQALEHVIGGGPQHTLKYPSDSDETFDNDSY